MFYSGGDFEAVPAPPGLPGAEAGAAVEGLRMRPGLAMSQVRNPTMQHHGHPVILRGIYLSEVVYSSDCCC